ncbi:MAG TPA: LuxR C-terminal-related transcriptional regulator [Chloroflexia bacterium]|nr:LuxR C-terminal-related transcriptional regulator [Chloroflexia bacterium]
MPESTLPAHNLPAQLNSFVGRYSELTQVEQLLSLRQTRLLTLCGAGGSGKTRLSLEVARHVNSQFKDGAWFVELAALTNPQLLSQQVARALNLQEQPESSPLFILNNYLKSRQLLLILDNCEHLLDACARLSEQLLKECPEITILATSRENLRVEGETIINVLPLKLPLQEQLNTDSLDELAQTEAIQLFLQRALSVQPGFKLTEQNRAEVVELCQSLDGLPLALELAAVRLRGLSITQLTTRLRTGLGARFQLLNRGSRTAHPRHQTLEALLQWSYDRLTEREQVILHRISIFAGGFPLPGAERVCQGTYPAVDGEGRIEPDEVLSLLSDLVNKSLLLPDETALNQTEPRYRLLETIRQYALEKAYQAGEIDLLQWQHLDWCIELAEKAEPYLQGPEQAEWLKLLELEHPNCRAALEFALNHNAIEQGLRLGGALWRFWQARSYFEEGRRWLQQILAWSKDVEVNPVLRAKVLHGAGVIFSLSDYPTSLLFHEENLRIRQALNDKAGLISALRDLGWLALHHDDFERARTFGQQSLELARDLGDDSGTAAALFVLSIVAYFQNEIELAGQRSEECLALWRSIGDLGSTASALHVKGMVALRQQNYAGAQKALLESLSINWQLSNQLGVANNIIIVAELGVAQDEQPQGLYYAVPLLGWLSSFDPALGGKMPPLARHSFEASLKASRARLDESTFQKLWSEGNLLSLEQAYTLAQQAGLSGALTGTVQTGTDQVLAEKVTNDSLYFEKLTSREIEVLRLVVTGLTNAQIAEKLFVTSRTVNAHLTSIYAKLEVTARSGAIRYAVEHHLV